MKHLIESSDGLEISEVNKTITLVRSTFSITGQIQEVVIIAEILVDFLRQILNRIFVGNVLDHKGSARVLSQALRSNDELA